MSNNQNNVKILKDEDKRRIDRLIKSRWECAMTWLDEKGKTPFRQESASEL